MNEYSAVWVILFPDADKERESTDGLSNVSQDTQRWQGHTLYPDLSDSKAQIV
jgi:hypothetical protein